jgi:hypothetical protein
MKKYTVQLEAEQRQMLESQGYLNYGGNTSVQEACLQRVSRQAR